MKSSLNAGLMGRGLVQPLEVLVSPSGSGWAQSPDAHAGSRRAPIQMDVKRSLGRTAVRGEASWMARHARASSVLAWLRSVPCGHRRTQEPRAGSAGGMTWDHPYLADLLLGGQEPPALGPSLEMDGLGLR